MDSLKSPIDSKPLFEVFHLLQQKKMEEAEALLSKGLREAEEKKDRLLQGLFYSTFGVLHKLRKDFKKAWKCYDIAEKLIPEDPALKIISGRLLLDYFGQADTVLKKMEKVIELAEGKVVFLHQAHTVKGLAYVHKSDKKHAAQELENSFKGGLSQLGHPSMIDFGLVSALMRKKWDLPLCRRYIQEALDLAKALHEKKYQEKIQTFLDRLAPEGSHAS